MLKQLFRTRNVTDYSTEDLEGVGTLRWEGEKCYRWVLNDTGSALAVGNVVCHKYTKGADIFKSVFDATASAHADLLAGVAISACPDDSYCWIQVFGYSDNISVSDTTVTSGVTLKIVDTKTYLAYGAAQGTAPLDRNHVVALESIAAGLAAMEGIIYCL